MKRHRSNRSPQTKETSSFRFVDLFCGVGGFHHALEGLGGECVFACEIDDDCRRVYREAFPQLPADRFVSNIRDITRRDPRVESTARSEVEISRLVPDHEVLCGGFPCQPFSKSGSQQGIKDKTRGTLFHDIMEIVRAKKPRYVILENVRNLAGPRHSATWRLIVDSFRQCNYRIADNPVVLSPHLIPPAMGGTPQVRERVFILAELVGGASPVSLIADAPISRKAFFNWNPDRWRISKYLTPDNAIRDVGKFRLSAHEHAWIDAWDAFARHFSRHALPGFPIWVEAFRARPRMPADTPTWKRDFILKNAAFYREHKPFIDRWLSRTWGADKKAVEEFPASRQKFEWQARKSVTRRGTPTLRNLVIQLRPSGIRVKPPTYLPALVAITQTSIVGPGVAAGIDDFRRLTPTEAAALQGIPFDAFERSGVPDRVVYRQLGNAVSVGAVRCAFQALVKGEYATDTIYAEVDRHRPLLKLMSNAS